MKAKHNRVPRYAGHTITVLTKQHGARKGTKRARAMALLLRCKTTDQAIPQLKKLGADNSFIRYAVATGLVKLQRQVAK